MLKYEETHHSYYCSSENYCSEDVSPVFSNWQEFKENWLEFSWLPLDVAETEMDDDLNHVFRFDIVDNECGGLQLNLYFMLQRKGLFIPITIRYIKEEDMPEISDFLNLRWLYLKKQWSEFSECAD